MLSVRDVLRDSLVCRRRGQKYLPVRIVPGNGRADAGSGLACVQEESGEEWENAEHRRVIGDGEKCTEKSPFNVECRRSTESLCCGGRVSMATEL